MGDMSPLGSAQSLLTIEDKQNQVQKEAECAAIVLGTVLLLLFVIRLPREERVKCTLDWSQGSRSINYVETMS